MKNYTDEPFCRKQSVSVVGTKEVIGLGKFNTFSDK